MNIRHQLWIETDKHIVLTLHEPFWGAWKMFGWDHRVEGIGVAVEAIEEARKLKKHIQVNIIKYGNYEITPSKAIGYVDNIFMPRDHKPLIVIPRDAFDRIPTEVTVKKFEEKEDLRVRANQETLFGRI